MDSRTLVQQPGRPYRGLFGLPFAAPLLNLNLAVAYVTVTGLNELEPLLAAAEAVTKRWLVGIDWYRSDPVALAMLDTAADSRVRVFDGTWLVAHNCNPRRPYHSKAFLLRTEERLGVVAGSGNISTGGLKRNLEVGQTVWVDPLTDGGTEALADVESTFEWFDNEWARAANPRYATIRARFEALYAARPTERHIPADDDVPGTAVRTPLTPDRLERVRTARTLWVETRALSRNLGPLNPGNELDLTTGTRLFFGFPMDDTVASHGLGSVTLRVAGNVFDGRSVRYNAIHMDVLSLPVPDLDGAPPEYDQQVLVFTRRPEAGELIFELEFRPHGDLPNLRAESADRGFVHTMVGGRQWGVIA